ncbi:hypothetical protein F5B20DRAFT_575285 [Whalleya microplaca]|nr:hypothetical protein F5B20DRAFT_575285 [Whalleya microplaca]
MDDTTSLVSELIRKLTELDYKVSEYRQDMAQEFRRYSQDLLQDVPDHVSTKVEKVIADQLQNYPALNPGLHRPGAASRSPDDAGVSTPDDKGGPSSDAGLSLTAALPHVSDLSPDDGPRSPHEREREFHGLFTPSYLPLLDAVQRHSLTPTSPSQALEIKIPNSDQDNSPNFLTSAALPRPDPVRRGTEDTISSAASDESSSRIRRSALRRSSSSSTKPQSPRRVRFEVEGQEVLPTTSPPGSPRASEMPPSPLGNPIGFLDESPPAIVVDEESTLLGSSPPRPKKITSTERLKAMARNSTEDTSNWEVVGNLGETDDDDTEDELVMASLNGRKRNSIPPVNDPSPGGLGLRIDDTYVPPPPKGPLEVVEEAEENDDTEEADDADDMLMMPPLSSFKNKKRFSPPLSPSPESDSRTSPDILESKKEDIAPAALSAPTTKPIFDEDIFKFDDSREDTLDEKGDKVEPAKYIEDEEDDEADTTPIAEFPPGDSATALYSTSPGIPIAKPVTPPPGSPPSRSVAASAGSYRGKSFSIDVVSNDEIHRKAAEMGDFYTFVGSVDGRSGVDETSSYRPELTYFNGTPRSLSERLMKEDWDDARRNPETNKRE